MTVEQEAHLSNIASNGVLFALVIKYERCQVQLNKYFVNIVSLALIGD